jgi:hypothetical protein
MLVTVARAENQEPYGVEASSVEVLSDCLETHG